MLNSRAAIMLHQNSRLILKLRLLRSTSLTAASTLRPYSTKLSFFDDRNFAKAYENEHLHETEVTHDQLPSCISQISALEALSAEHVDVASQLKQQQQQRDDEEQDLRRKAKIQVENLNKSFGPLIRHMSASRTGQSSGESELRRENETFNKVLLSYVDVCCNQPGIKRGDESTFNSALDLVTAITKLTQLNPQDEVALQLLNNTSSRSLKKHESITDITIYNRLMFELAKQGRTSRIIQLFKTMRSFDDNLVAANKIKVLEPNLYSYAAVFQSLGFELLRLHVNPVRVKLSVQRVFYDMQKSSLDVKDLADSFRVFTYKQREEITAAVRLVVKDFEFKSFNKEISTSPIVGKNETELLNRDKSYYSQNIDRSYLLECFNNQIESEKQVLVEVPSIQLKNRKEKTTERNKSDMRDKLIADFRHGLTLRFMKLLRESKEKPNYAIIRPFLTAMPPEIYVDLLLKNAIRLAQLSQYFSPNTFHFAHQIGTNIELKYHEYCKENDGYVDKLKLIYADYIDYQLKRMNITTQSRLEPDNNLNNRQMWLSLMEKYQLDTKPAYHWPDEIVNKLGNLLFDQVVLKGCKIKPEILSNQRSTLPTRPTENFKKPELAFHRIYRIAGMYKESQIKIHPLVSRLFDSNSTLLFEASLVPMTTPPVPWLSSDLGGYLLSKSSLIRLHYSFLEMFKGASLSNSDAVSKNAETLGGDMSPVYDSLNVLSTCPWRINTQVLDLLIEVFNNGGSKELEVAESMDKAPQLPKVPKPPVTGKDLKPKEAAALISKEQWREYFVNKTAVRKQQSEMYSLWCTELYRLSMANLYRNKIIWFPHSLDFRGRTYPIPPHFNHLGGDISRSIILLAEGKKLGPNGLDMLKLHLINLTGTMKKSSLQDRLLHANKILPEIIDSAEKPFTGLGWWKKSEEKWQTLACCIEIANALKCPTGPADYVSYFPIHQDGSCNGLQHYAALGRDQEGAVSVNLFPAEKPQDVYTAVLELVEKERAKEEDTVEIAKALKDKITRKTIKQTVMTTVYNVTFYGAKLQIQRQLEDQTDLPRDQIIAASGYIADKTFSSIKKLFKSARLIQDWLSESAYLISRVHNTPISWCTPLGLHITQPYFRRIAQSNKKSNKSPKQMEFSTPNYVKQRNAFPPNFIHSLDSCHMMLTALNCERAGVTFVSVHDCFWTHASTTHLMNQICREQFVSLHSLPLLENLSDYFIKNYGFTPDQMNSLAAHTTSEVMSTNENQKIKELMIEFNKKLVQLPPKGEFNLSQVMNSIYFFS